MLDSTVITQLYYSIGFFYGHLVVPLRTKIRNHNFSAIWLCLRCSYHQCMRKDDYWPTCKEIRHTGQLLYRIPPRFDVKLQKILHPNPWAVKVDMRSCQCKIREFDDNIDLKLHLLGHYCQEYQRTHHFWVIFVNFDILDELGHSLHDTIFKNCRFSFLSWEDHPNADFGPLKKTNAIY